MPFYMNEDRELIRSAVREFVETEVKPVAMEIDENETFPLDLFKRCGEMGFTNIYVPEEYGGSGLDLVSFCIVVEEISKECASLGQSLIAHAGLGATALYYHGTEEQRKKWLVPIAKGESVITYCMTEPAGNANKFGWSCMATADGDDWIINGTKCFCTNIGVSDYYLVGALTAPMDPKNIPLTFFMVEKGTPGFSVGKIENKVGWRGTNTGTLYFDNVRVPKGNMVGPLHGALSCRYMTQYEWTASGACAVGVAQAAYDKALDFAATRKMHNGVPYAMALGSMRSSLAEMKIWLESIRSMVYNYATIIDNKEVDASAIHVITMIKPYCFKVAEDICSRAVNLHGGLGVCRDTGVEKFWRDAKVGLIGGGQYETLIDIAGTMISAEAIRKSQ